MAIWTEWDKLTDVIVGDCHLPGSYDHILDKDSASRFNLILEETKEDLERLSNYLKSLNCNVRRPDIIDPNSISLPTFDVKLPNSPLIPRDQYLVLGDTIYQTYTSLTDRYFDGHSFYNNFLDLYDEGYNWIAQPAPQLVNLNADDRWWIDGKDIYGNILQDKVLWHTATMYKAGDCLITNIKGPGTQRGLNWCKKNIKTTIVENDSAAMQGWGHIDHGFFFVNDETIICESKAWVPTFLFNKNIIEIGSYIKDNFKVINDYAKDYKSANGSYSKEWLEIYLDKWRGYDQEVHFDTNALVLDHNHILFSREIPELFKYLESHNIQCDYCDIRHNSYWEAGIHCLTLDVKREGLPRKVF